MPSRFSPTTTDRRTLDKLVAGALERRPRPLARALTLVDEASQARRGELIGRIWPYTGKARTLGITGPPGAGKSTLVDQLVRRLRCGGDSVAVLAVDPTSPVTGGAVLGDRVRMQGHAEDPGVFIRSLATRGALGGLSVSTYDAVDVLDAAGFDWIIVETVGVGQDEIEVAHCVESVVVVTVPGLGDGVQAIKAGILEIASVYVVNKCDHSGAEAVVQDLETMLGMGQHPAWRPSVLRTEALRGVGVDDLVAEIVRHQTWLEQEDRRERQRHVRLRRRIALLVQALLRERLVQSDEIEHRLRSELGDGVGPYTVAEQVFDEILKGTDG